jgi:hypothetical protein
MRPKLAQRAVSTRKTFQGAWECSALVDGRLTHRQYFFYTKRAAVRAFVRDVEGT